MYVVCFNGPPRSGKDTMASMLAKHLDQVTNLPVMEIALSLPLRKIAYEMVGWPYMPSKYEDFKTTQFPQFGGKTGRQLMIDVSESFLKPVYGQDIMAKLLIDSVIGFDGILLITDSGFQCEIKPLIDAFGSANLYVAQVHRPGTSFKGDSREWVCHPDARDGIFENYGTLTDLRTEAIRLYGRMVNQLGWKL